MKPCIIQTILTLGIAFANAVAPVFADEVGDSVRSYRQSRATDILQSFREFVSIPNVSADGANIGRNAIWIRDELKKRGVASKIWDLPGANPVVFGELRSPAATRTVVFYAHFDGQPVDESQWLHAPFTPTLMNADESAGGEAIAWPESGEGFEIPPTDEWRMYGRGTSDDRAAVMAMLTAMDALQANGLSPQVNIKFLFDGEEEIGSPNLRRYLESHRQELDADLWLFCDGPVHQTRKPQLVFGVRGIVQFDLTVYGANRPLHSGHYGNWAPNPALNLAKLLASMKDSRGEILIDGFYESIEPLGGRELDAISKLPNVDDGLLSELGLAERENPTRDYYQSLMFPSLNIRGLQSATVGKTARNIVPNEASATLDIRLVKGNEPGEMLKLVRNHLQRQGYHIVYSDPSDELRRKYPKLVKFQSGGGTPAERTPLGHPLVQDVITAADLASDEELLLVPTLGGTLPISVITDRMAVPVVIVPIANHDNNQHAPNENIRLGNLWYGVDVMARLFLMK
ncbi:MAG: M20/M25/M40 family metallo-hydrolase [Pirellulales bacterium]|nr:M20/M25/M40 family metallo-hydrolase [Pirellulales bacterium]